MPGGVAHGNDESEGGNEHDMPIDTTPLTEAEIAVYAQKVRSVLRYCTLICYLY